MDDVLVLLQAIALGGRHRLYNVASGRNVSNRTLADLVGRELSIPVTFAPGAPHVTFPPVIVDRIRAEFGFVPRPFEAVLSQLIATSNPMQKNPLAIVASSDDRTPIANDAIAGTPPSQ